VALDERTGTSFGRRAIDWERKGVPVRVELGPRDLAEDSAVVVTRYDRSKAPARLGGLVEVVSAALEATAAHLHTEALAFRDARIRQVSTLDEAIEAGSEGFAVVPFSVVGDAGEDVLAEAGITVRCLQRTDGTLAEEGDDLVAVVGKAY
jgi:prolyl-tRNA synthetase